jgi:uncharacterized protein (DUF433 family)
MNIVQEIIVRNVAIMNGKPIIKGTRITVELILKKLSEGATIENIIEIYPHLSNAQILATLDYAATIIGNEELLDV